MSLRNFGIVVSLVLVVSPLASAMPAAEFVEEFGTEPPATAETAAQRSQKLWERATTDPTPGIASDDPAKTVLERDRCQSLMRVQQAAKDAGFEIKALDTPVSHIPNSSNPLVNTRTDLDIVLEFENSRTAIEHKYYPNPQKPLRLNDQICKQMHTLTELRKLGEFDDLIYYVDGHVDDAVIELAEELGHRVVRSLDALKDRFVQCTAAAQATAAIMANFAINTKRDAQAASLVTKAPKTLSVGHKIIASGVRDAALFGGAVQLHDASKELLDTVSEVETIRDTDTAHIRYIAKVGTTGTGAAIALYAANPLVASGGLIIVIVGPDAVDVILGKRSPSEVLLEYRQNAVTVWHVTQSGAKKLIDSRTYKTIWAHLTWDNMKEVTSTVTDTVVDAAKTTGAAVKHTSVWAYTRCKDGVIWSGNLCKDGAAWTTGRCKAAANWTWTMCGTSYSWATSW